MYDTHAVPESGNEANNNGIVLRQTPKRLSVLMGWTWIGLALSVFFGRLGGWLLLILTISAVGILSGGLHTWQPGLGMLSSFWLHLIEMWAVCIVVYCTASQVEEGRFAVSKLPAVFRRKLTDLLLLGILQLTCLFAIASALTVITLPLLLLLLPVLAELLPRIGLGAFTQSELGLYALFFLMIIATGLFLTFLNAFIVPAIIGLPVCLVLRHSVPPTRAIKMGIRGASANLKPLTVYALTIFVPIVLAKLFVLGFTGFAFKQLTGTSVMMASIMTAFMLSSMFSSICHGVISYVFYLTAWTDAEWEF